MRLTRLITATGKFQFEEMKNANPMVPLLFFVFVLCNSWVLINLLLTLIIKAFEQVRDVSCYQVYIRIFIIINSADFDIYILLCLYLYVKSFINIFK